MIEKFFGTTSVCVRLKEGPLAEVIGQFLEHLDARGYARMTVHQYVQAAEHFAGWLARKGETVSSIDSVIVERFVSRHLGRCSCPPPSICTLHNVRAGLNQLLASIRGGSPRAAAPVEARHPVDDVLSDFETHLKDVCGAAPATQHYYLRETRSLLLMHFGEGPVDLAKLTLRRARAFVAMRAKSLSPASANVVATATRSFLRYLQFRGIGTGAWIDGLPRAAVWRLAHVPRVLTDAEVDAILASFDCTRGQGRRDYAIALCMVDLGLRAGEVARLTVDDVNWRALTITIAPGKTRRGGIMPLPARLARALADYLRHGRPTTQERALFVHHRPPRGQRVGPDAVRSAIRLAYARAGLDPRLTGTHILRHTAATRLLRAGVSMKEIADVLRHRSLDTTAIYAKVDLPALTRVALPWPEVQS
jgi:site-specific recombinase XerD